jgi:hypothetical protein
MLFKSEILVLNLFVSKTVFLVIHHLHYSCPTLAHNYQITSIKHV